MSRVVVARARADIKDMYVDAGGREMVPFLGVLDGMLKRGIEVRLIHAKEPDSPAPKASGCPRERSDRAAKRSQVVA